MKKKVFTLDEDIRQEIKERKRRRRVKKPNKQEIPEWMPGDDEPF